MSMPVPIQGMLGMLDVMEEILHKEYLSRL
jgi:hypothetical protein